MTKPHGVLALDLATVTGFASDHGISGALNFWLRRGESPGMKFLELRAWMITFLQAYPTKLIVYEQSGYQRSNAATHSAHGFIATVETLAAELHIEITNRSPLEIKKHALPDLPAKKRNKIRMIQAAENLNPDVDVVDDNHADALLLLDLILTDLGMKS